MEQFLRKVKEILSRLKHSKLNGIFLSHFLMVIYKCFELNSFSKLWTFMCGNFASFQKWGQKWRKRLFFHGILKYVNVELLRSQQYIRFLFFILNKNGVPCTLPYIPVQRILLTPLEQKLVDNSLHKWSLKYLQK